MKRLLCLIIALCAVLLVHAQGVEWKKISLEQALKVASLGEDGKTHVFVDCYTSWCRPCQMMLKNVFPTKECGDWFNPRFVNIKINMESEAGLRLAKQYPIDAYPTFLILDSTGKLVAKLVGGAPTSTAFIQMVEEAIRPSESPEMMLTRFETSKAPEFLYKYLEMLQNDGRSNDIRKYVAQNCMALPSDITLSKDFWKYIDLAFGPYYPQVLEFILSNKFALNRIKGREAIDKYLCEKIRCGLEDILLGKQKYVPDSIAAFSKVLTILSDGRMYDNVLVDISRLYDKKEYSKISAMFQGDKLRYVMTSDEYAKIADIVKYVEKK